MVFVEIMELTVQLSFQADKLNSLIKAAGVADVEPIWATLFAKALEGKDVKDLLLNVGSGGGAAAAPAAGGAAAAGGAVEAAPAEEEKEEGTHFTPLSLEADSITGTVTDQYCHNREGRVRRGHGLRSLRLSVRGFMYCPQFSSTTFPRKEIHTKPLAQETKRQFCSQCIHPILPCISLPNQFFARKGKCCVPTRRGNLVTICGYQEHGNRNRKPKRKR